MEFHRKDDVSFTEMLGFLVKYLVLFDTSSLYKGKQVLAKLEDGDLYDNCFNSSSKVPTKVLVLSGGSKQEEKKQETNNPQENETEEQKRQKPGTKLLDNRVKFNDKGFNFKTELTDLLNEGAKTIKNGLAYVLSFIAFASIYPAIPFFAVLAVLYGIFNWLFNKIKFL